MPSKTVFISIDVNSGVRKHHSQNPAPNVKKNKFAAWPPVRVLAVFLVVSVTFFLNQTLFVRANSTVLYPSVCLGGWNQTHLAEGKPNVLNGEGINEVTGALLSENASAQIFCSRFIGTVPKSGLPREMRLKLYVRSLPRVEVSPVASPVPQSDVAVEPGEISSALLETASDPTVEELIPDATEETVDAPGNSDSILPTPVFNPSPDVVLPPEPPPYDAAAEPVSWLQRFFAKEAHAFSEETQSSDEETVSVSTSPESVDNDNSETGQLSSEDGVPTNTEEIIPPPPEAPTAPAPDSVLSDSEIRSLSEFERDEPVEGSGALLQAQEATSSDNPSENGMVSGASISSSQEPVLELSVSFDGVTRKVVGRLAEADFETLEFDIPLSGEMTWEDFAFLEVSLARVPTVTDHSAIALDGMSLTVFYDVPDESTTFLFNESEQDIQDENEEDTLNNDLELSGDEVTHTPTVSYATTTPRRGRSIADVEIDHSALHSCSADPFRVEINAEETEALVVVKLVPSGTGVYRVTVGSLPAGLEVRFDDGTYERFFSDSVTHVELRASRESFFQEGDFTVALLYTKISESESTTLCQVNVLLPTPAVYE